MSELAQDLIGFIGLLAAAIGAGGLALVIAKQLRLDRHFSRVLHTSPRTPERTLELMIRCSELASREGLLRLEAQIAESGEPLLIQGVNMALEGRGERDIRQSLNTMIEQSVYRGAARSRFLTVAGFSAQAGGIALATALLIGCLALAGGLARDISGLVLLLGGATGLLAIVAGSLWSDAAGMTRASEALCDLIIAEGVILLRAGRDSRAVAQTLSRLLPPSSAAPALAQAA